MKTRGAILRSAPGKNEVAELDPDEHPRAKLVDVLVSLLPGGEG
jgi:hypothetical protein